MISAVISVRNWSCGHRDGKWICQNKKGTTRQQLKQFIAQKMKRKTGGDHQKIYTNINTKIYLQNSHSLFW